MPEETETDIAVREMVYELNRIIPKLKRIVDALEEQEKRK